MLRAVVGEPCLSHTGAQRQATRPVMRQQILERFQDNIARARNLVSIHSQLGGAGRGRRPLHASDVLRGATVLLHASLEEVLRSVAAWRFPTLGEAVLNEVPMVGHGESGRPEKFFLGRLANHRTKSVQQLIDESVAAHLSYFNINNTTEIASFMRKVGVESQPFERYFPVLSDMIARRHHIVHQADRNELPGRGQQRARALSEVQVNAWIAETCAFVDAFVAQVPDELL
jgi:hypothetical protein